MSRSPTHVSRTRGFGRTKFFCNGIKYKVVSIFIYQNFKKLPEFPISSFFCQFSFHLHFVWSWHWQRLETFQTFQRTCFQRTRRIRGSTMIHWINWGFTYLLIQLHLCGRLAVTCRPRLLVGCCSDDMWDCLTEMRKRRELLKSVYLEAQSNRRGSRTTIRLVLIRSSGA